MKPRGRRSGRNAAALQFATADLFAPGRSEPGLPAKHQPATDRRPAALHALQPMPQASRPRLKQLWHAVVFPELVRAQHHAPQRSALTLERLALSAQRFTSSVSLERPDALLLEIKGSVRLFGSLTALQAAIEAEWRGLLARARWATAPTTLAALWLARAGKALCIEEPGQLAGVLADLPLVCTGWNRDWLQRLRAMGATRIGEVLRLPRAGLARRLSPNAIIDLDIALGRQAAPRRAFVPRERFRDRYDFETEIETMAYLQNALEPSLERCARFLRGRQAGIQTLMLVLRHRVLPLTRVRLGLASVTSERRRFQEVLDAKLARLELPAPVRGMELISGSLQPLSADSFDAFAGVRAGGTGAGSAPAGDTAPQLVERLRARLGERAVYGIVPVAEHRPEAAWQRIDDLHPATAMRSGGQHGGGMCARGMRVLDADFSDLPRPVWLLDEPRALAPGLQQLLHRGLVLEHGPERIESGWWDGKDVARDYYIARQAYGVRWWIFEERQSKAWYLHGVFA